MRTVRDIALLGSLTIAAIIPVNAQPNPRDLDINVPINDPNVPIIETAEQKPTVLTFYENPDFSGASYTAEVQIGGLEATRVINSNDISSAGLNQKISSVRLTCGSRASRASLFDVNWSQHSRGKLLECDPQQTANIDLSTDTLSFDLNDKINAAAIVTHPSNEPNVPVHSVGPVSTTFRALWKTEMDSLDDATNQWTQIWLDDFHTIHVEQALKLDSFFCSERDAVFELRIVLSTANYRPVFQVYQGPTWVAPGTGDAWGCRDKMLERLNAGIKSASTQIPAKMAQLFPSLSPLFYFAPGGK
jgi:hypothetical protein